MEFITKIFMYINVNMFFFKSNMLTIYCTIMT